jgi:hypothetical protein
MTRCPLVSAYGAIDHVTPPTVPCAMVFRFAAVVIFLSLNKIRSKAPDGILVATVLTEASSLIINVGKVVIFKK